MDFEHEDVEREYLRWIALVGEDDPYSGKTTAGLHDVLRAHFLIVDFFVGENRGIGGIGPKSLDLLHSAIYRQFVSFAGRDKWASPLEKCATLLYGLVKDHPFHDANKRTAFLVTLLQLQRQNRTTEIKQRDFEDFVVDVAEGNFDKHHRFKQFKATVEDPEIHFIADHLKRCTREIDRRQYTVTYNELRQILKRYGLEFSSPVGSYIDVIRASYRTTFFGFGKKQLVHTRIAQVGFPGWKRQVSKAALKSIRESAGLTPELGYDSKTFFQDANPLNALLDEYEGPLRRLADR